MLRKQVKEAISDLYVHTFISFRREILVNMQYTIGLLKTHINIQGIRKSSN